MIAYSLCQVLTQEGFREPLEGRARNFAERADHALYEEILRPTEEKKAERLKLLIYTAAAYLALC